MKQPHNLAVAGDLRRPSGIYAAGGSARVCGGYGRHLGPRPHHDRRSGCYRLLVFLPRGGADVTLPLSQQLYILAHAVVTVSTRGFPQDTADIHAARARVEALRVAFEFGANTLDDTM